MNILCIIQIKKINKGYMVLQVFYFSIILTIYIENHHHRYVLMHRKLFASMHTDGKLEFTITFIYFEHQSK